LSESGNTLSIDTAVTADLSTAQTFTNKSISGGQITSAVANATLAATVTTNANLTGDVTSVGNATTLTNAPVISKVLTGYTSGAGTVAATDTILQAFQKINGNDALRETSSNKDASGGYAGLTLLKLNLRNAANTITNFFTTAATVARTWTMPDKDGTVAMTSDITGINSGTNTGDQTTITGNAGTATALQTARTIGGTSFDGTANISISTVAATALTGTVDSGRLSGAYSGVTGLGTLTALAVDNVSVDLNTISTTSGALNMTPLAGQDLKANLSGGGEFTIYGGETWWGDSLALGFLGYTGGMPIIGSIGALALGLYTNGVERLRIDSSGNVGIGTSSPAAGLQIGNASGLRQALISGGGYDLVLGASGGAIFGFASQTISTVFNTAAVPLGIGTNATQPLIFGTSGTEHMRLDSAGNVGIGTSSPAYKLDVSSSANSTNVIAVTNTDTTTANYSTQAYFRLNVAGNHIGGLKSTARNLGGLSTPALYLTTAGAYPIAFGLNDSATPSMVLDTSGNLGIGTASPTSILDVYGGDIYIRLPGASSSTFRGIRFSSDTTGVGFVRSNASTGELRTEAGFSGFGGFATFYTDGSERMRIDVPGNVGIGTAAPNANALLDVTSTTKAFMPPRMTTTQKNAIASPTAGMMVYDSTLNKLSLYTTAWETVTSI
jgi:hypothetical protein